MLLLLFACAWCGDAVASTRWSVCLFLISHTLNIWLIESRGIKVTQSLVRVVGVHHCTHRHSDDRVGFFRYVEGRIMRDSDKQPERK